MKKSWENHKAIFKVGDKVRIKNKSSDFSYENCNEYDNYYSYPFGLNRLMESIFGTTVTIKSIEYSRKYGEYYRLEENPSCWHDAHMAGYEEYFKLKELEDIKI